MAHYLAGRVGYGSGKKMYMEGFSSTIAEVHKMMGFIE
jgi:hypothetical protein